MKKTVLFFLLMLLPLQYVIAYQEVVNDQDETTILFVRHAERAEDGTTNPPISEEGEQRAVNLYHQIKAEFELAAIYSTAYKRTLMTATPTADSLEIDIVEYGFDDLENWLSWIISEFSGKAVLIVGHSNTTPRLINMVIGREEFEQLNEHDYGDLFIVQTSEFGDGTVEIRKF